jgi:homoserine kinase
MPATITVHVPATSANLGPGFDCLGLALDLWNATTISLGGKSITIQIKGEGKGQIPCDENNLIIRAMLHFYKNQKLEPPKGISVTCKNQIPLGSGLGSSAAAVLTGLLGANALANHPASPQQVLKLACEMEGHPDNVAAAMLGGLVVSITLADGQPLARRYEPTSLLQAAVAVPDFHLPTHAARAALPKTITIPDAVYNIGHTALVVEALHQGDLSLLAEAMQDRLHQPYRLGLIPGGAEALAAARQAGAQAAAISGAGPSMIAFCEKDATGIAEAMVQAFKIAGLQARPYALQLIGHGVKLSDISA